MSIAPLPRTSVSCDVHHPIVVMAVFWCSPAEKFDNAHVYASCPARKGEMLRDVCGRFWADCHSSITAPRVYNNGNVYYCCAPKSSTASRPGACAGPVLARLDIFCFHPVSAVNHEEGHLMMRQVCRRSATCYASVAIFPQKWSAGQAENTTVCTTACRD